MASVKGYTLKLVNSWAWPKELAILLKMLDVDELSTFRLLEASLSIALQYGDQYIKRC